MMTRPSRNTALASFRVLVVAATSALGGGSALGQDQKCSDPKPSEQACVAVRPLGAINGCACFICYSATENREKAVCTRDQRTKEELGSKPKR